MSLHRGKSQPSSPPQHVAVVAHSGKTFGGGLLELRKLLDAAGHPTPIWYEVPKSKKAPRAIRRAIREGADLLFVWGGDGMVQRCIDALADKQSKIPLAILPAGTANLLAKNLGIPTDLPQAVDLGLKGIRQALDVGVVNGEHFAVMAGTGLDAITMRDVSTDQKELMGRLAYFRSGVTAIRKDPVLMSILVNGRAWFTGKATCVLTGNVGTITGGIKLFPAASPVDGKLEVAVVTANTTMEWARVFARLVTGRANRSPFVRATRAKKIDIELAKKAPYELDGGDRKPTNRLKFRVEAGAITVCVPAALAATRRTARRNSGPPKVKTTPTQEAPAAGAETSAPVEISSSVLDSGNGDSGNGIVASPKSTVPEAGDQA